MDRREFLKFGALASGAALGAPKMSRLATPWLRTPDSSAQVTLTEWDGFAPPAEVKALTTIEDNFGKTGVASIDRTFIPPNAGGISIKLLSAAASHTLPDIFITDPEGGTFAADGLLVDLTSRVEKWGGFAKYSKGIQEYCSFQGRVWGLPFENNNLCLYYNEDMLKAANVKVPTTWAELTAAAKALTNANTYGMAVCGLNDGEAFFQYLPTLWQAGADLDDLASSAAVAALTFWSGLVKNGYASTDAVNWGQQDVIEQFVSGKAAMCYNGPWNLPTVESGAKFKWAVAPLPTGKVRATVLGGEICMLTIGTKHPDQAFDFLTFLNTPSRLDYLWRSMGAVPTLSAVAAEHYWKADAAVSTFSEAMAYARPRNYGKNYPTIQKYMEEMLQATMLGKESPESASKGTAPLVKPLLPK